MRWDFAPKHVRDPPRDCPELAEFLVREGVESTFG
jgi:hypothetical protein